MAKLNPNDVIDLDEDFATKANNLTDAATKKNLFFAEILDGQSTLEVIIDCEGCGETLSTAMLLVYPKSDDDDEMRDSVVFCKTCSK